MELHAAILHSSSAASRSCSLVRLTDGFYFARLLAGSVRPSLRINAAAGHAGQIADAECLSHRLKYEPHELDYPVLFLYRHTVEVYLKAALDNPPEHHDLSRLIQLLEAESGKKIAGWVRDPLWDFHQIDNMAAVFRYADPSADGELWIDFRQLRAVIDKLVQAIEQYMEQKRRNDG